MCRAVLLLLIIVNNNFIFTDTSFFTTPSQSRAINVCLTCAEDAARKEHSKRQQTVQVSKWHCPYKSLSKCLIFHLYSLL